MIDHKKYKAYIFDLDNTLYDEVKYLYPAFSSISRELDIEYRRGYLEVFKFLKNTFDKQGRKNLFDRLIIEYDFSPEIIDLCLQKLRTVKIHGKINLKKDMKRCIARLLSDNKKLYVLTNGNIEQQKNKVEQINWNGMKENISFYFANEIEPKPSPAGILKIIADHNLNKEEILFIGDDEVDRLAAEDSGVDFIYGKEFNFS
ncbi:MAG: HAD-IA family hydrolase [Bacteroidia bacterium]